MVRSIDRRPEEKKEKDVRSLSGTRAWSSNVRRSDVSSKSISSSCGRTASWSERVRLSSRNAASPSNIVPGNSFVTRANRRAKCRLSTPMTRRRRSRRRRTEKRNANEFLVSVLRAARRRRRPSRRNRRSSGNRARRPSKVKKRVERRPSTSTFRSFQHVERRRTGSWPKSLPTRTRRRPRPRSPLSVSPLVPPRPSHASLSSPFRCPPGSRVRSFVRSFDFPAE